MFNTKHKKAWIKSMRVPCDLLVIYKFIHMKNILGIDVGGSGIKGAVVNCNNGKMITDRNRIVTPSPATPSAVLHTISELVKSFKYKGPIGIGFPSVVKKGKICTAANIDKSFIGINYEKIITDELKMPIKLINDADAAGLAEFTFGAGKDNKGFVILITIGTGLGTVLFYKGKLIPNTELGHIYMTENREAEQYISDATRQKLNLSWEEWGTRLNEYLLYLDSLFWPDLFIIGGGASKHLNKYHTAITTKTKVVSAELLNNAGIIGAALSAKDLE
jgi:polyphosphate glucokinase